MGMATLQASSELMVALVILSIVCQVQHSEPSTMLICVENASPPSLSALDYFRDESDGAEELMSVVGARLEIRGDEVSYHPARTWILVLKDYRSLLLCEGDSVLFNYPCSIGDEKRGKETPSGWYRVISKIENPVMVWESGTVIPSNDWRNSFGSRWIGLGVWATGKVTDYGIHGTNSPEAIGREISMGCVRMYNWDAEAVFAAIDIGTLVVIK